MKLITLGLVSVLGLCCLVLGTMADGYGAGYGAGGGYGYGYGSGYTLVPVPYGYGGYGSGGGGGVGNGALLGLIGLLFLLTILFSSGGFNFTGSSSPTVTLVQG